ncbi:uncharacterized protein [Dermacentor albipictus]|uniref:uncharacterized protein isoform X2 n=1 Tax=Dermacentor albipictus TaxID=60249 RepID=UPI0031FCE937
MNDDEDEIRSPDEGDFGEERDEEEEEGEEEEGKEGAGGGGAAVRSSPDSDYDAGGEKRHTAHSIFQACKDYRQNIINQANSYSFRGTVLAVGGTICFLVLAVSIFFLIISGMGDGSKSSNEGNETSIKPSDEDNISGPFVLDHPHPDDSVGKEFDLYGSVAAFAEDLFLDEEASPQEPKNTSGLEDSYLNALDVI